MQDFDEYHEGDRVRIVDGSEANGDTGTIWRIQENGVYLVELDVHHAIWPCTSTRDFEKE